MQILVAVERTAGSPFTPDDVPVSHDLLWAGSSSLSGYPVGDGYVPESWTDEGGPANVLLLMEEPARPGPLCARPVALLHTAEDGQPYDEVLCVPVGDAYFASLADAADLPAWHADKETLAAVLSRLRPGHIWQITACEGHRAAEGFLTEAHHFFEHLTGSLE
ncbi:inorganic diphosphatase [Streptomyces nodosus]